CCFQDIPVGVYALSRTCRSLKELPVNLNAATVRERFYSNLRTAIASVQAMEQLLLEFPVRKLLLREIGYVPADPVLDTLLQYDVDCLVLATGQRRDTYVFKRYRTFSAVKEHEFSVVPSTWQRLQERLWTDEMDALVPEEFNGRYN